MKKVLLISLLLFFAFSKAFCQKNYKLISSDSGVGLKESFNKLVSEGYNVDNYMLYEYSTGRYKEYVLMSKDETTIHKSYLILRTGNSSDINIVGDLPSGFSKKQSGSLITLINKLAELGYTVEFYSVLGSKHFAVISKIESGDTNNIRSTRNTTNENAVIEKARYNLNGIPVNENEKGIQIIVYSDYTTKIINVK